MLKPREVKVKYALVRGTDKSVFIKDVDKKIKSIYYCTECKSDLIPVIPVTENHRQWHFRHATKNTGCRGGRETVLHQRAKEILAKSVMLRTSRHGDVWYTNAFPEKVLMSIRPDVTAEHNGEKIIFEILVSHPIEEKKRVHLEEKKLRCVEIDLSKWIKIEPDDKQLEFAVLLDQSNREDLFWDDNLDIPVELLKNKQEIIEKTDDDPNMINSLAKAAIIVGLSFAIKWLVSKCFPSNQNYSKSKLNRRK